MPPQVMKQTRAWTATCQGLCELIAAPIDVSEHVCRAGRRDAPFEGTKNHARQGLPPSEPS